MKSDQIDHFLTAVHCVKRIITCGYLDAPMTIAECMIILSKPHTIGGISLRGSAFVDLEPGSPSVWPVLVLSFLEITMDTS